MLEAIKVLFDSIVSGPGIADLGIAIAVIRPPETYTIIKNKSPAICEISTPGTRLSSADARLSSPSNMHCPLWPAVWLTRTCFPAVTLAPLQTSGTRIAGPSSTLTG